MCSIKRVEKRNKNTTRELILFQCNDDDDDDDDDYRVKIKNQFVAYARPRPVSL